jgi:hypothetical protein
LLFPAGDVHDLQRLVEVVAGLGVFGGAGRGGGHRPVRRVQVRDPGDPLIAPVPQLHVGVAGTQEISSDVGPAPQRVNALDPGEGLIRDVEVDTCPGARPDRISFTAALETAGDQVIAAVGIIIPVGDGLVGLIGQAVLNDLLPATRDRGKARSKKNPTSKYGPNAGSFPQTSLKYSINTTVAIMEEGLTARSKR